MWRQAIQLPKFPIRMAAIDKRRVDAEIKACSRPWRRVRTLALVVHATCSFSVSIGAEGSHVPNNRLTRAQATYMPDTVPRVNRFRRNSSRGLLTNHGFDIV